ncbi:uncharacterized protein LOC134532286 [Bacillus rossius redtenbacheri]|uniref:uncharacterized protein LOC134532286 n=1 Tax=Bacillus rossius redtenbacheri TaxID=93214 RepID=UPI002FDE6158
MAQAVEGYTEVPRAAARSASRAIPSPGESPFIKYAFILAAASVREEASPSAEAMALSSVGTLGVLLLVFEAISAELWQQEVGSQMDLGDSGSGYRHVNLRCGADYMQVEVRTQEDFSGVIYTRGSYNKKDTPCFLDPRAGRDFSLRIPLGQCHTKQEDDVYSNVVVIQHDDELIMPGDAAFTLECDFSRPRDVTVNADLSADHGARGREVSSRISLANVDPAGKELPRHTRSTVANDSDFVVFTPEDVRPRRRRSPASKDEL